MSDSTALPRSVCLAEILDLRAAAPLAIELLLFRGADIQIDASRVEKLGAQCLQVLLSAASTWHNDGATLDVVRMSPRFVEGLELLGIPSTNFLRQEHIL
jgi:chemotaxis protein CheX